MNRLRKAWLNYLFIGALTIIGACQGDKPPQIADLILLNGNVVTVDPDNPNAAGIAIKDGIIIAVGSANEVESYHGEQTEIVDLEGKTAVPGLIDAHMHFPLLGKRANQLFMDKTTSPGEAIVIVRNQIEKANPGEWVTGQGWHTVNWSLKHYPDNLELSAASPDNPVFLIGMASHAAWVNDMALQLSGITRDTPNPPGGQIIKDSKTGKPTGILLETATELVSRLHQPETHETKKQDIRFSIQTALSFGLTEVHDAGVGHDVIKVYKELLADGELKVRLYVMYSIPDGGEVLDEYISRPPEIGLGNNMLTLRSLKAYADGALGARGAALLEPYSDSPNESGLIQNADEEIYRILFKSMKAGYQVAIHAIGDRGNRMVLNAVEKAQKEFPGQESRTRIEHAQILSLEDIPRFASLGVIPSMQPIHCTMDMGFAEARVGRQRIRGGYAWKSLLQSGARIVASADTPAFPVEYSNPLWGIHAAVSRHDNQAQPAGGWYPEETVSRLEALKMYTIDAAYAAFEEKIKGSLTPGKLADVTVFSKDILSIPEHEILETEVLMTIVGGSIVFRKDSVSMK